MGAPVLPWVGLRVPAEQRGQLFSIRVRHCRQHEAYADHEVAPFGRLPTPEQPAELAVWFTRPQTAHITGRIFLK